MLRPQTDRPGSDPQGATRADAAPTRRTAHRVTTPGRAKLNAPPVRCPFLHRPGPSCAPAGSRQKRRAQGAAAVVSPGVGLSAPALAQLQQTDRRSAALRLGTTSTSAARDCSSWTKPAVCRCSIGAPLAIELDEFEQSPRREADGPVRCCLPRVRPSPPVRSPRSLEDDLRASEVAARECPHRLREAGVMRLARRTPPRRRASIMPGPAAAPCGGRGRVRGRRRSGARRSRE
jgi:hypothetical protein